VTVIRGSVAQLSFVDFSRFLKEGKLALEVGSLVIRCRSIMPSVAKSIYTLYKHHPFQISPDFADFYVEVKAPANLRRWYRPQAEFLVDGERPFEPLPKDQAPALFEWGINWMVAASCHFWFTIHAASLERNGQVLILPAPPGSGKSTLCAALAFNGWRLFSDELTLLDIENIEAQACARPINLKNESIDIIRRFVTDAEWSPEVFDTLKGRVTHLAPPIDSVMKMRERAFPRWVVFPKYVADAEPSLTLRSKPQSCIDLAENALNYSILGETGFNLVTRLIDHCDCYDFIYSRLEDALLTFEQLAESEQLTRNGF